MHVCKYVCMCVHYVICVYVCMSDRCLCIHVCPIYVYTGNVSVYASLQVSMYICPIYLYTGNVNVHVHMKIEINVCFIAFVDTENI